MPAIPDTHRDLLDTDVAMLATISRGGFPQVTAVWFLLDGDTVKLSLNTARQKVKNLQARPECTLFILDRTRPQRYLEIRARAELIPDPDYAFADRVGQKYGGTDLRTRDRSGESRVEVILHPVRINAVDLGRR